uniref:Uncharacterized protein n=1 Tax=viral metagenome TaxID=1070528 RepID=A0A6C0D3P5_9ZZZZ
MYIEKNKTNEIIHDLLISNQCNTLYVHLRSGDKGVVDEYYINTIANLSVKYEKIIILCGVHQNGERNHIFPSVSESIANMKLSLSRLYSINSNIVIDLSEPDIHLSIMRKCKNLLLHKGGYSLLGGLIFDGDNLFITNAFSAIESNNSEYFTYLKKYTIL